MLMRTCRLAMLLALSCVVAFNDVMAWPPGGVFVAPIPGPGGQLEPRLLSGPASSVFAYWSDGRYFEGSADLFGQLLTRYGAIAPGWPDTGIMIAKAPMSQRSAAGLPHPDGSFIVGFTDERRFGPGPSGSPLDAYVTRVLADGRVDPSWPRHGFMALDRPGADGPDRMTWVAPDTLVIMSYYEDPADAIPDAQPLLQRVAITASGPTLPWGSAGRYLRLRPNEMVTTGDMVSDGVGGVFVLFDETEFYTFAPADMYLMRVGADGEASAGWEAGAKPVCTAAGIQEYGDMCEDGSGGVFVTWADSRDGAGLPWPDYQEFTDIRLLRLDAQGQPHSGWPAEGLLVCDAAGWQFLPRLMPDGTGGVYVSFDDLTIGLTRVNGDGSFAPGWARNGIQISTLFAYCTRSRMVPDGIGGVYVLFEDAGAFDFYLQHVLPWGTVDPSWPSEGYRASPAADGDIVSDGEGGCYVASARRFPGETDPARSGVFVTRYSPDGVVPVKLAEATVEVEAGRVHIQWHGVDEVASQLTVQRRPHGIETWTSLGSPITQGRDVVEYEDTTVEPGARYAYRLTRGAEILSEEHWVTVPASAVFALAGARPNPAMAHEASVAFTLAGAGPARLEVLDLAGRRVHERTLAGLGPGPHTLSLAEARLAPGVHWLRLTEGTHMAHSRVVVVR